MRLGFSEELMRLRGGDRGKILEEVRQRMPAIQIIEKRLHRHPGPRKARRPAHDLGINGDDARLHAPTLARLPRLAQRRCVIC